MGLEGGRVYRRRVSDEGGSGVLRGRFTANVITSVCAVMPEFESRQRGAFLTCGSGPLPLQDSCSSSSVHLPGFRVETVTTVTTTMVPVELERT